MVLQPVRFTLPLLSPIARCALTAPFHLFFAGLSERSSLFSVALSVTPSFVSGRLLFQGARCSVLSGLSSTILLSKLAAIRRPVFGKVTSELAQLHLCGAFSVLGIRGIVEGKAIHTLKLMVNFISQSALTHTMNQNYLFNSTSPCARYGLTYLI